VPITKRDQQELDQIFADHGGKYEGPKDSIALAIATTGMLTAVFSVHPHVGHRYLIFKG